MRFVFANRFGDAIARSDRLTRLVWWIEGALVRLLWWGLVALGPERASRLGSALLRRFGPRTPKKAELVRQTLRLIRPEASTVELDRLEDASWAGTGAVFGEYAHLERLGRADRLQFVDRAGLEAYRDRGRSAVFFGAHYANWELLALALARAGVPMVALYAPLQNPHLDRLISSARDQLGCGTHARGDSIRPLLRHLREGGSIGTLIALRVADGVDVPFFGHTTRLPSTPARLALGTGCALIPIHARRLGRARYRVTVEPRLEIADLVDREDAVAAITRRMIEQVEAWVREDPAQWLIANRRWDKTVLDPERARRHDQSTNAAAGGKR
jgi:KDO2-lipid IV(A) lauroyltransferase